MRSRATAALTLSIGVLAGACGSPSPSDDLVGAPAATVAAVEAVTAEETAPPSSQTATDDAVMVVDVAGPEQAGAATGSATETGTGDQATTSSDETGTTEGGTPADQTTTTAARTTTTEPTTTAAEQATTTAEETTTTAQRTTTTQQTTTTERTTTQQTTTTQTATSAPGSETRPEILAMALPIQGGGTFDPDTLSGRNVLVWFWGPH